MDYSDDELSFFQGGTTGKAAKVEDVFSSDDEQSDGKTAHSSMRAEYTAYSEDDDYPDLQISDVGKIPVERLYKGKDDEQWLMSLNEFDRETVLERRMTDLATKISSRQLAADLNNANNLSKQSLGQLGKRSSRLQRSESRSKAEELEHLSAMTRSGNLKRTSFAKIEQAKAKWRAEELLSDEINVEDDAGDDVGNGQEEDDYNEEYGPVKDRKSKKKPSMKTSEPAQKHILGGEEIPETEQASLQELNACLVRRNQLEEWIDSPYTSKVLHGNFVRANIGADPLHGPIYKLAQINDIVFAEQPYKVNGRHLYKVAELLSPNGSTRRFSVSYISNSSVTPLEFEQWKQEAKQTGRKRGAAISRSDLFASFKKIAVAEATEWTKEDVDAYLKERRAMNIPSQDNLANRKARLVRQRDILRTKQRQLSLHQHHLLFDDQSPESVSEELSQTERQIQELEDRMQSSREAKLKDMAHLERINEQAAALNRRTKLARTEEFEQRFGLSNFELFQKKKCRPIISIQGKTGGDDSQTLPASIDTATQNDLTQVSSAFNETLASSLTGQSAVFQAPVLVMAHNFSLGSISVSDDLINTPLDSIGISASLKTDEHLLFERRGLSTKQYKLMHGLL